MFVRQLFLTSLLFLLVSCGSSYEPQKVKNVPLNAFWAGGSDGGNWFIAEKTDTINKSIHFKIYHDFTGELLVDKNFTLKCVTNNRIDWNNIKNLVSSFDGERIYLQISHQADKFCYFE